MSTERDPQLPATVSVPEDVLWQEVENRVILLDLGAGEYHSLNEVGSRMWMELADSGDVQTTVERLLTIYDVEDRVLSHDLGDFIAELVRGGLLTTA